MYLHTDPLIVEANPAVPHFKVRNHNPSVSIQRYCPISPHNIVEVCQPQQLDNIQSSIEVRSAPTTLCTKQHRFTLWSHLTVCLNHFESLQKSFSVASQNFPPPRVSALSPARARCAWPAGTHRLPPKSHRLAFLHLMLPLIWFRGYHLNRHQPPCGRSSVQQLWQWRC